MSHSIRGQSNLFADASQKSILMELLTNEISIRSKIPAVNSRIVAPLCFTNINIIVWKTSFLILKALFQLNTKKINKRRKQANEAEIDILDYLSPEARLIIARSTAKVFAKVSSILIWVFDWLLTYQICNITMFPEKCPHLKTQTFYGCYLLKLYYIYFNLSRFGALYTRSDSKEFLFFLPRNLLTMLILASSGHTKFQLPW